MDPPPPRPEQGDFGRRGPIDATPAAGVHPDARRPGGNRPPQFPPQSDWPDDRTSPAAPAGPAAPGRWQPHESLLPQHPDQRAPDDSWLNRLGPAEPGQRHPDTGEIPLYQQQLETPPAPPAAASPFAAPLTAPPQQEPSPPYDEHLYAPPQQDLSPPYDEHLYAPPQQDLSPPYDEHLYAPPLPNDPIMPTDPVMPTGPVMPPGPATAAPPVLLPRPMPDYTLEDMAAAEGLATQEVGVGDLDVLVDEEAAADRKAREVPELPYLPGLEGLRGAALVAVLAFAGGISQVRGGFLGISTALTLTGFLLATKSLTEWGKRASVSLTDLWQRRAERIIPPYYFLVALVVLLQLTVRVGSVPSFRRDVWAAVGFVTNWQLAYPGDGFTQIFKDLSGLQHLWPIAIAVQLTIVIPVVLAALMAVTSRTWRTAAAVFAAAGLASFIAAWIISGYAQGHNVTYYGTHTRAGEVLVGVVLAYLVMTPRFRRVVRKPRVMAAIRGGGLPALAALLALWMLLPIDSSFLFQGGTMLNAALTAWIILAVTMPGPTPALLGAWPLKKLGEVSFCAYLLHWPLFLLLNEDRMPLDGYALFGVQMAATLAAAVALRWAIESTFRWRLSLPRMQLAAGLGLTAVVLALAVVVLPVNPPVNISLTVDNGGSQPGQLDVVTPTGGDEAARVLIIGDETAASMVPGVAQWNEANPDAQLRVDTHVAAECPLGGPWNTRRFGETVEPSIDCVAWPFRLPKMLDAADYDVIVVAMGSADLGQREVQREWRSLGDPAFDQWMGNQLDGLGDRLAEPEAPVLWLTAPHVQLTPADIDSADADGSGLEGWAQYDDNDPDRVNQLNHLIHRRIGSRSGFEVEDLDAWLQNQLGGEYSTETRVGTEFTEDGATAVSGWLVPKVLEAAGVEVSDPADNAGA